MGETPPFHLDRQLCPVADALGSGSPSEPMRTGEKGTKRGMTRQRAYLQGCPRNCRRRALLRYATGLMAGKAEQGPRPASQETCQSHHPSDCAGCAIGAVSSAAVSRAAVTGGSMVSRRHGRSGTIAGAKHARFGEAEPMQHHAMSDAPCPAALLMGVSVCRRPGRDMQRRAIPDRPRRCSA